MDNPVVNTPLSGASFDTDGLSVSELGFNNKINLRGQFDNAPASVDKLLGVSSAISANTYVANGSSVLFWLGPNERLFYTDKNADEFAGQLRSNGAAAAVDVSDYYTVLQITGDKARAALASGTPFDVHPNVFADGQCAQIRFGNASVLLSVHDDQSVYRLQVRWSFAQYVYDYLKRVSDYV